VTGAPTENPVSATAYWTLSARYADATGEHPVGNDIFAERFMNDEARSVADRYSPHTRAAGSFPVRHRMIDELVARELERDPSLRVVLIGAGFDSRAYRLDGGRWLEIDEPALLAYKEPRLPAADAPNDLSRVPIRFGEESLEETLRPYATEDRVVVVLEGVLGYLTDDRRGALLATLIRLFPSHLVVCDLQTRTFLARYGRKLARALHEAGATFGWSSDTPEASFLERRYRVVERVSIPQRGADLGARGAPPSLLLRLLPSLRDGYCVWAFEHRP
jgi:methyltransferase (TIGR00027 family)